MHTTYSVGSPVSPLEEWRSGGVRRGRGGKGKGGGRGRGKEEAEEAAEVQWIRTAAAAGICSLRVGCYNGMVRSACCTFTTGSTMDPGYV